MKTELYINGSPKGIIDIGTIETRITDIGTLSIILKNNVVHIDGLGIAPYAETVEIARKIRRHFKQEANTISRIEVDTRLSPKYRFEATHEFEGIIIATDILILDTSTLDITRSITNSGYLKTPSLISTTAIASRAGIIDVLDRQYGGRTLRHVDTDYVNLIKDNISFKYSELESGVIRIDIKIGSMVNKTYTVCDTRIKLQKSLIEAEEMFKNIRNDSNLVSILIDDFSILNYNSIMLVYNNGCETYTKAIRFLPDKIVFVESDTYADNYRGKFYGV